MPEALKKSEVAREQDPAVAKQYDTQASTETKFKDFYELADHIGVGMLGTNRNGIGHVSRCMATSKRTGPDFLFLANANSQKVQDLRADGAVSLTYHDSARQDWISLAGTAVTASSGDPRIREIYSKGIAAWFGDLKDGVHDGGPEDPRMLLIEVQPKYITYYKRATGMLGMAKEVGGAVLTGGVAVTGNLREMGEEEIREARGRDGPLSSK